jgi:oxygen-dependent protoporphyrinogen oxidase
LADVARRDAEVLLGVSLPPESVVAVGRKQWIRPEALAASERTDGVVVVGETVGGTGLAGIIAHAYATADRLLVRATGGPSDPSDPSDATEAEELT